MKRLGFLIGCLTLTLVSSAQEEDQHLLDSLQKVAESDMHDTLRLQALIQWDGLIYQGNPELDLELNERILKITDHKMGNKDAYPEAEWKWYLKARGWALNSLATIMTSKGEFEKAIPYLTQAYQMHSRAGNMNGVSSVVNNLGIIYQKQGNYKKALENYLECLSVEQERGDTLAIAKTYNNIGIVHEKIDDFGEALRYYRKSLNLKRRLGIEAEIASTIQNIGNIKEVVGQYDSALYYYNASLEIEERTGDKRGIAESLYSISTVYERLGHNSSALNMLQKALRIGRENGFTYLNALTYKDIGYIYNKLDQYTTALPYCDSGLVIAERENMLEAESNACNCKYQALRGLGRKAEALDYLERFIALRDSMKNSELDREIIRMEYEQEKMADSLQAAQARELTEAKLQAERAENRRITYQNYFAIGGLLLALVAGVFIFNRFRVTRRQKNIIEKQKYQVDDAFSQLEEKNKEVVDSITYAKRIQEAILPSMSSVKTAFPNSFIMYRPKDIVAGDFYWLESSRKGGSQGWTYIAAADCTGHGVPGAMVSVVCHNALNRSTREFGLTDPGEILTKTRELVVDQLSRSQGNVKDGMDIAMVSVQKTDNNSGKYELKFAGAFNPIWVIRKNGDGKVEKYAGTKQPVGKVDDPVPFETITLELEEGDAFYIFSDGYVDQFGGEKGKKYKHKPFMRLIEKTNDLSPDKQLEALNIDFDRWKGPLEQLDDVCVIGVRL